ncbi:MAG: EF-hand domain-containing protein [Micavibrio sp.]|nr:EF-hand domain-containing protein [Micavibrio sp.]
MKKTLMMVAMAACIASPALANDMSAKGKAMSDHYFSMIDTNGDGAISKDESTAFNDKMFAEADTNNDGKISKAEMTAMHAKQYAAKSMHKGKEKSEMEVDKPKDNSHNTDDTNDQ